MTETAVAPASSLTFVSSTLAWWTVHDASIRCDLTSTALRTTEGWWLVDPAPMTDKAVRSLAKQAPILGILLTNENHVRAAKDLAELGYGPVHAHEATLGHMDIHPDVCFCDDEILKGKVKALHIPGATEGESCFYDARTSVVVMGDALIHLKETGFALLPDKYAKDPTQSKQSLQRLLDLEFETMMFAHGPPLTINPRQQLQKLLITP